MDTLDLFRQLTKGTRFTKRKNAETKETVTTTVFATSKHEEDKSDVDDNEDEEAIGLTAPNDADMEDTNTATENDLPEFEFIKGCGANAEKKKKKQRIELTSEEKSKQLIEELTASLRKQNQITVLGKNIPSPVATFEDLQTQYKVSEQLMKNVIACNYPRPTPIQMQAMPVMMHGRPLMACAPTGSGKTIAFLVPIINDLRTPQKGGIRAIVLAPTRELAQQIYRECIRLSEKTALKIHFISKVSQGTSEQIGAKSDKKYDILITTPNRVRFSLQQEPPLLDLKSIEWFVIDEADRLMEEGQTNFKEQLDDIIAACTNPKKKLALFSATYTVPVAKWALRNLKNLVRVRIGQQNSAVETVNQELLFVGSESGKLLAVRDLVRTGLKPPVLVFVQSKERAKQLFSELLYDGINVDVIHANRTQQQRDNCVRAFRQGKIWVLICTELMGRGIDFKGVNLVINYDFPPTVISYIHRIGRTGRAGRPGRAITYFTQDDTPNLRSIALIIKNAGGKVPDFLLKMKKPRKTEKKEFSNYAPKRDDISTKIKPEPVTERSKIEKNVTTNDKAEAKENDDNDRKVKHRVPKRRNVQNLRPSTDKVLKKKPQSRKAVQAKQNKNGKHKTKT